jgi:hypothetical protein
VNCQPKISEAEFQRQVIDIAQWHNWLVDHTPPMRSAKGAVFTGGLIGKSDLVLFSLQGKGIIYAELKSETGKLSKAQAVFRNLIIINGGEYYLWKPNDLPAIVERLSR